jgi:hypothetical protein
MPAHPTAAEAGSSDAPAMSARKRKLVALIAAAAPVVAAILVALHAGTSGG